MTTAGESPQCFHGALPAWQEHLLGHPLQPRHVGPVAAGLRWLAARLTTE